MTPAAAPALEAAESSARKAFRAGTDRLMPPAETLRRVQPLLRAMGITRVSNVTGLDSIGIPVYMACRPNSRALATSQGKGLDPVAAKVSAIMESLECFHAERIAAPLPYASYAALRSVARVADPYALPRPRTSPFTDDYPILWVEGRELLSGESAYVPYEMVHTDYRLPRPQGSGCFLATSNGLASGNHPLEATSHALCEVVERHSSSMWLARGGEQDTATRVDLASVDDPLCREALARFDAAEVDVGVWETTSEVGIASFHCRIAERRPDPRRALYDASGDGCHPRREIALLRALTEAAQSRVTVIAGSRDDVGHAEYRTLRHADTLRDGRGVLGAGQACRAFGDVPTYHADSFDDDVRWELDGLRAAGISEVVAVDLTMPAFHIPVIRVVVPGLENIAAVGSGVDVLPGERLQRALAEAA